MVWTRISDIDWRLALLYFESKMADPQISFFVRGCLGARESHVRSWFCVWVFVSTWCLLFAVIPREVIPHLELREGHTRRMFGVQNNVYTFART
jgi:hypothetical protein